MTQIEPKMTIFERKCFFEREMFFERKCFLRVRPETNGEKLFERKQLSNQKCFLRVRQMISNERKYFISGRTVTPIENQPYLIAR